MRKGAALEIDRKRNLACKARIYRMSCYDIIIH